MAALALCMLPIQATVGDGALFGRNLRAADNNQWMPALALAMHADTGTIGHGALFGQKEPCRSRNGQQSWIAALALCML
jgi:hypothetical protein